METYNSTKQMVLTTPVPQQTRTYKPISNAQLIDLTLASIEDAGFKVENEFYSSAREGMVANGRYALSNVKDKEMQIQIAWQNSYNKAVSLKFAIGVRVFVCGNGCVSGDMGAFKRKHQGSVQEFAPQAITDYIKKAGDVFTEMQKEREMMKTIPMNRRLQAELIGRMFIEDKFISSSQANLIANEIKLAEACRFNNKAVKFDYNAPNSLWELYNFTTQSMRDVSPTTWMQDQIDAHKFFVNNAYDFSGMERPKIVTSELIESDISPNQLTIFTDGVE